MDQMGRTSSRQNVLPEAWNDSFLLALALTGHVLRSAFESFVGIPMSRLRLLAYMYGNGELSQADIQRHLEVDGATVTRQVKQLQAEGLLQRRVDPKDNRFTLVTLTEAGQGMVETLMGRGQEFQLLAIQNIEPESLGAAVGVLAQMRCNLQTLAGGNHCPDQREEKGSG